MLLKLVIRNSIFSVSAQIVNLLLGLIFAGMTIRYLGPSIAGFFLIATSIFGWSQMAGGGSFQAPAVLKLAQLFSDRDRKRSRDVVRTVTSANLMISSPFAIATIVAFPILFSWSQLDISNREDAFIVVLLASIGFLTEQWASGLQPVYEGYQRYDLLSYTKIIFGILGNLSRLLVLVYFSNMAALAVINLCIAISRLCVDIILVNRLIGGGTIPGWKKGVLGPLMTFGVWNWLGNTSNVIYFSVTNLILAKYLGSSVLPYIALPQSIVLQIGQFIISGSYFIFPTLAGQGKSVVEDINRIEDRMRWIIAVVSIGIFGGLFLAGPWFLSMLVNEDYAIKAALPLSLYCLYGIVWSQEVIYTFSTLALGRMSANVVTGFIWAVFTMLTTIILIPSLSYVAICVAQLWRIPGAIVHTIWCQKILGLRKTAWETLFTYLTPIIGLSTWSFVVYAFRWLLPSYLWVQLLVFFIGFCIYLISILFFEKKFFYEKERLSTIYRAFDLVLDQLKKMQVFKKIPMSAVLL